MTGTVVLVSLRAVEDALVEQFGFMPSDSAEQSILRVRAMCERFDLPVVEDDGAPMIDRRDMHALLTWFRVERDEKIAAETEARMREQRAVASEQGVEYGTAAAGARLTMRPGMPVRAIPPLAGRAETLPGRRSPV